MSAPNATTTVNTLGIQGPPGPPALSTTLSGTFVVPAVGSSGIATLTSASGAVVGSWVTVVGGGTFLVTAVGVSQLTLQNNGATGNASAGTFCNPPAAVVTSGPQGPGGAAGSAGTNGTNGTNGADAFSSTTSGFTQPTAGNTVTVTVGHTSGFAAGQVVYVTAGGYYTLTSITDATHFVLTNLGYVGNAGSGALVASGSTVTAGGLVGPAGSSGFTAGGDLSGTSTSQQVLSVTPPTTAAATASPFIFTAPRSTNTNATGADLRLITQAPTGTSVTETGLSLWRDSNTAGNDYVWIQPSPSFPTLLGSLYLGTFGATRTGTSYTISGNQTNTFVNAPGSSGKLTLSVAASGYLTLMTGPSQIAASVPILGDGVGSPWGAHGVAAVALSASRAATAAEYAMGTLVVSPTAGGFTLTMYAPAVAAFGYTKVIVNTGTNSFTLSTGTGTTFVVPANSKSTYVFSTTGVQ